MESPNPFRRLTLERAAFAAEVPNLDDVRAAYLADELEADELDALTEAAVFERSVELPPCLQVRAYARRQMVVRFPSTDAPGRILGYKPPPPRWREALQRARDSYL